ELSALLRGLGLPHTSPHAQRAYPRHYLREVQATDLLIQTPIPIRGYLPVRDFVDRLIAAGETATRTAFTSRFSDFSGGMWSAVFPGFPQRPPANCKHLGRPASQSPNFDRFQQPPPALRF